MKSSLADRAAWWCATAGGLGAAPFAPGTFGTLGGVLLAGVTAWLWPQEPVQTAVLAGLFLLVCAVNVWIGPWAERAFGGKDPQAVVIDEVAGLLLTALIAPRDGRLWLWLLLCFAAFRVFDILKPPPARQLEKLPQGWGVLLDDLAAGVYAGLAVRLGLYLAG